ncbi:MAG: NAD-glutamate dehydrogenase, partial [Actinobacteria bacterium]
DPPPPVDDVAAEIREAFALTDGRNGAPAAVRAATSRAGGSLVETNTADLPFLVDSVQQVLAARGLQVVRDTHPIIGVERDAKGHIVRVGDPRELPSESVMHFEIDRRLEADQLAELEDDVREALAYVQRVVGDFKEMTARVERFAEKVDDADEAAFLRWLLDGNFVLLGVVGGGPNLGLARGDVPEGTGLQVGKTAELSPVHRRARMDAVTLGGIGRVIGLFTSQAYAQPASSTPLLHVKLEQILSRLDFIEGSHDYKAAITLFDSFPKDELFAADAEELQGAVSALLNLRADESRLLTRLGEDGRTVSLIAAIPRARFSAEVRDRVRDLVAARYGADGVDVHEVLGEGDRMQVHLLAYAADGLKEVSTGDLQAEVRELARTWDDRLREELVGRIGHEPGRMLAARWARRLPEQYKASLSPADGAEDVECLEKLATGASDLVVGLANDGGDRTRVSLYKRGPKVELGRATPLLEHLGLRAIEEFPTRLEGEPELWVQSFSVLGPGDAPLDLERAGARIAETLRAVWHGESESDSLNRLIVLTDLGWEQIEILRAYRRYRQRIGSRYTESFQNDVIAVNPRLTEKLMRLFELRFDPASPGSVDTCTALREEILGDLDAVELLDHDRILRNQLGLIEATVRTNVYARGHDAMAFKLRSGEVPAIPQPAPMFEIYVYAPDMEGIHLRGGRIARGGIRWSDRMDYRTEVFGLMRAQMTKNAIIVPAGAKGGFFLKERPSDPAQLKREVERQYVRYIEALLDVTDNLLDGEVSHPDDVIVHDEDDTYLVVAADKGTATFSDTANEIAVRRRFWLGDAFASGGSAGYDHKALGITAKGAWESVKRHFRELGIDPGADVIAGVGIGDMSGDVFGLRPPPRLHRPRPGSGAVMGGAQAAVRAGCLVVGRLRQGAAVGGRRCVLAGGQAHRAVGAGAVGAGHRARRRALAGRGDPGGPARAGRPALERWHRDGREGLGGERCGCAGPLVGRDPGGCRPAALPRDRRGRQPRPDAARADRVRAARRPRQRRLHRQLRRRRLLRPRGQPEDPARRCGPRGRPDARGSRRAAARRDRRRRAPRARGLLPAGADHRPGGPGLRGARLRLRGPDGAARGGGVPEPRRREAAAERRDGRAPARGGGDLAPGAGGAAGGGEALADGRAAGRDARRRLVLRGRPAWVLPTGGRGPFRPPAGAASAAARAGRDDRLQRRRELDGLHVRVAAAERARRAARGGSARVPDGLRGHPRARPMGARGPIRAAARPGGRLGARARGRHARGRHGALVPVAGQGRGHALHDRPASCGLRAARAGDVGDARRGVAHRA